MLELEGDAVSRAAAPVSDAEFVLEVEDLVVGFGANQVLHGVSFSLPRGSFATLLGLNGAGKSVTLQCISGLIKPWSGRIRVNGAEVQDLEPEERAALGLAHVPQGRAIFPDLTVEENLRLGGYLIRRRSDWLRARDGALEVFPELAGLLGRPAGSLSGGQQVMVSVARALVGAPKLILVDEPTQGLAPRAVEALKEALSRVNRQGSTVLLVEHNVAFALSLARLGYVMQMGRIVYQGRAEELSRARLASLLGIGELLGARPRLQQRKRRL